MAGDRGRLRAMVVLASASLAAPLACREAASPCEASRADAAAPMASAPDAATSDDGARPVCMTPAEARAALADAGVAEMSVAHWCCPPDRLAATHEEMRRIADLDQADRTGDAPLIARDPMAIFEADYRRRARVSELFAQGCLETGEELLQAALVFQHGTVPEHYLQAFFFASRAAALGERTAKHFMALAIDRYLIAIGHRQLFGSQARTSPTGCACLSQVERSFPDEQRLEYLGKTLEDQFAWARSLDGDSKRCASPRPECADPLEPTTKGSVPGVW